MRVRLMIWAMMAALSVSAQTTMRDVLRQMPDTLLPYLTENNRLDMIDFMDSGMRAEVSNIFDGKSELTRLTDNYARLWLNQAVTVEMQLFDVTEPVDSATQIVCMVTTYGTDIRESTVEFYSLQWKSLTDGRWLAPDYMFRASLGDEQPTLTITPECRLEDAPANKEQEEITKPSTILKWDGKSFKES